MAGVFFGGASAKISAAADFHFGVSGSHGYTSQPLKPPMWRNGRRNGLKIRWAEKARAGSNPAIGKPPELDRINKIDRIRISLIVSIL